MRSKKRFDRPTREAILKRAEEIGARDAAAEASISMGTLRTWRKRLADEPAPSPSLSNGPGGNEVNALQTRAEKLRARAEKARDAQCRADDRANGLLARGSAGEARNAIVVANGFGDRAVQLEEAARLEEAHETALTEDRGRLVRAVIERGYGDLGLPVPVAFVQALLRGWPEEIDAEVVEQARDEVRRPIRAEVRAELMAELEAERLARPALAAGDKDSDDLEIVDAEVVAEPG